MIFIDTETTGLSDARLVELSYKRDNGPIITIRCKPTKPIEIEASCVNGISNDDVADLPYFKDMPEYVFVKKLLESPFETVIGHNVSFDLSVLNREDIHPVQYLCTKDKAKTVLKDSPRHNLQYLRYYLNLKPQGHAVAHTSAGDVAVLYELWKVLSPTPAVGGIDVPLT